MNIYPKTITRVECFDHMGNFLAFDCNYTADEIGAIRDMAKGLGGSRKIHAIKIVRTALECGLKEAKYFVEDALNDSQ